MGRGHRTVPISDKKVSDLITQAREEAITASGTEILRSEPAPNPPEEQKLSEPPTQFDRIYIPDEELLMDIAMGKI